MDETRYVILNVAIGDFVLEVNPWDEWEESGRWLSGI